MTLEEFYKKAVEKIIPRKDKLDDFNKKVPACFKRKKTKGQTFGEPFVVKCGKIIKNREWIEEGREDTEVSKVLEKYGVEGFKKMTEDAKMGIYADISSVGDLRSNLEKVHQAEDLWKGLPLEIREEFNHDKNLFIETGLNWAKKKSAEILTKREIKQEQPTATEPKGDN